MPEKILRVKMLGGFSLRYDQKEIVLDRNAVSKTTQLLQMILLYAKEGISKAALIDALYGREEVENKNGSLNNTIFRLRKQLKASGLPDSSYIVIWGGICRWDRKIPVQTDCLEFERIVRQGQRAEDKTERMNAFLEGCRLYTGEFLPSMIGEDWVTVRNIHYRDLYFSCLTELCDWLKEEERYEEIYQLTTIAAEIYPFEEWQIYRIDSLIAMARYKEAMEVYEKTSKMFFDELSLPPSPEMLKRFRLMSERISQSAGAIEDIKNRLVEREKAGGAYYCTFPSFVDIYHVISRMMERNGVSVYIMLCTLRAERVGANPQEREKEVSLLLKEAIRKTLRRGDFYTKYNEKQYLIMLSGINQENCGKVSGRINDTFRELLKRNDYKVDYYVASVAEVEPIAPEESQAFRNTENIWKK